jgi:hypothetical protein
MPNPRIVMCGFDMKAPERYPLVQPSNSQNHHSSGGRKAIHSRLNGLSRLGINDQGVRRKLRGLAGCPAHPDIKTPMKSKPVPCSGSSHGRISAHMRANLCLADGVANCINACWSYTALLLAPARSRS